MSDLRPVGEVCAGDDRVAKVFLHDIIDARGGQGGQAGENKQPDGGARPTPCPASVTHPRDGGLRNEVTQYAAQSLTGRHDRLQSNLLAYPLFVSVVTVLSAMAYLELIARFLNSKLFQ